MKLQKFIIYIIFMFCFLSSCGDISNAKDFTQLRYDKNNHILLIQIFESAKYINKIELDLQQDTLLIDKVSKRTVSFFGEKSIKKTAKCTIKLLPNVKFVKLGDTLFKLSEIDGYSQEELIEIGCAVNIVFPQKFPYIIR